MAFAFDGSPVFARHVGDDSGPIGADGLLDLIARARPPWMADAACREHPELDWFPDRRPSAAVLRVCASCLVRADCAAAGASEPAGVWGGIGEQDRRRPRPPRPPQRPKPTGAEDAIATMAGEGLRPKQIAARLNGAGVEAPGGARSWWAADVATILRRLEREASPGS